MITATPNPYERCHTVKAFSAIIFAVAGYIGGMTGEIWHMHHDPGYSPELGMAGAVIGLGFFAILFYAMIYSYGVLSQRFRREDAVAAPMSSAVVGLPFWAVLLPLHTFLRDRVGLSDNLWWLEAALLCAISFEIIRFSHEFKAKTA